MIDKKETASLHPAAFEAGENAQPRNPLLVQALRYAESGWPVFPLKPRGKTPLTPNGFKDATMDKKQIMAWWEKHPDANIGIVTGTASEFFVLDIDGEDGEQSLKKLEESHSPLPPTGEVITGGGGRHLYFKLPDGRSVRNSTGKLGLGLDIRGDGGYIVAPPSIHSSGKPYACSVDSHNQIAPPPDWLVDLVREDSENKPAASMADWKTLLGGAEEGQRNDSLARLAGLLFGSDLHPHIAAELCLCWNEARCTPPLLYNEALRSISSIAKRELQKQGRNHG